MLRDIYGTEDYFFKEIDQSIRKGCSKMQDVQVYLLQFQNFTQNLMMLTGNLMKFKLRLPSIFKKALYSNDGKNHFRHLQQEQLHGPKRTESGCWSKTIRQTFGIQPKMDNRLCISGSHAGKKGEKASKRRIRQGFCTKNLYDKTKNIKFVGKIVSDGWQW